MVPAAEPRTRWRLTIARSADVAGSTQRDVEAGWAAAIDRSDLPVARAEDGRPRLAFAAPLPVGMAAEREWVDIFLFERWPQWRVREAVEAVVLDGWTLRELADVWLGAPALAGVVAGADYRITLGGDVDADAIAEAASSMLAEPALRRSRTKGTGTVDYDLRPLLVRLEVVDAGPPTVVLARTRIHPSLGSGRPDEVIAALGERVGRELQSVGVVRQRLLLADEVDPS